MDDLQIGKVAAVLAEWNPLGANARGVADLDGYRTEAIDIIMAFRLRGKSVVPDQTVSQVLNQAFDLTLEPVDCTAAARKIQRILHDER